MPTLAGKDILSLGQSVVAQKILDTEKAAALKAGKPYLRTKTGILSVVAVKPIAEARIVK